MKKLFTLLVLVVFVASTVMAASKYATATGNWSAITWYDAATAGNTTTAPTSTDDVFINNGVTVIIDQAVTVANLTIGQGTSGTLIFNSTAHAVSVGNVTVAAGAKFVTGLQATGDISTSSTTIVNVSSTVGVAVGMTITGTGIPTSTTVTAFDANTITLSAAATATTSALALTIGGAVATNTMSITGNIINNGTFDMSLNSSTMICNVTFSGTGEQDISGTSPVLTRFRGITLAKSTASDKVKSTIDTYFGGSGLLLLTTGTWEQNAGNLINTSGNQTLGSANGVLLIDGSGGYTNYNSTYSNASLGASLAVSAGTFTVNTTGIVRIGCGNNSLTCTTPGVVNLTAGTIFISGRLTLTTGTSTINGANIFIDPNPSFAGASALSGGSNAFEVSGTSGVFNFSSGSVTLVNPTNTAAAGRDLKITSTGTVNITNGIIYIGDGVSTTVSTGSAIYNGFVNGSSVAIPNLVIRTGGLTGRNFGLKTSISVGKLTMTSGAIESVSGTTVTYTTGGTLTYNAAAAQTSTDVEFPATGGPANLTINNANGVALHAARTISGALTLTSGKLSLGANDFTLGSISGASAINYIVTNGAGRLIQPVAATTTTLFPVGASATSYDPVSVTPATASNFSVKVSGTLSGSPTYGVRYNAKEWDITPVTPSSTLIALTPSNIVESVISPVIGHYLSGAYTNSSATMTNSNTTFTGTFDTFSPFVTGANIDVTALAQTKTDGVSFDGQTVQNPTHQSLRVYDATGRFVLSSTDNINMSSKTKGVYLVQSQSGVLKVALIK